MSETVVTATVKALPPTSFVRRYVAYGAASTDAPASFHILGALSLLGSVAPSALDANESDAFDSIGTFWSLLVGDSGDARKTSCIRIAEKLLTKVDENRLSADPGSPEGLLRGLVANPTKLLTFPEFGAFLSASSGDRHKAHLREYLMQAYDGGRMSKELSAGAINVPVPRLSCLAGVAPDLLEKHLGETDWKGGFAGRMCFCFGARERHWASVPDTAAMQIRQGYAEEALKWRLCKAVGTYGGKTSTAKVVWDEWVLDVQGRYAPDATIPWARSAASRTPVVAHKAALLLAYDLGLPLTGADNFDDLTAASDQTWLLDEACIRFGIAVGEMHLTSLLHILVSIDPSKYGQEKRRVLLAVGKQPRTMMEIQRRCFPSMDKKDIDRVLTSLESSRHVKRIDGAERVWIHEDHVTEFQGDYPAAPSLDEIDDHGNVLPFKKGGSLD